MQFRILVLFITFLFSIGLSAQDYKVKTTQVKDYLGRDLHSKGFLIDSNNFLWMTSPTHLIKKVGNEYLYFEFNHPLKKKNFNRCYLKEINNNKILGFTEFGVFVFSVSNSSFEWIHTNNDINYLNRCIKDSKGNFLVSTSNGWLYRYTVDNDFVIEDLSSFFKNKYDYSVFRVIDVQENGSVIIGVEQDLYLYKDKELKLIFKGSVFKDSQQDYINKVVRNGKLFPKDVSGMYRFMGNEYQFIYIPEIGSHVFKWPFGGKSEILHYDEDIFVSSSNKRMFLFKMNSNLEIEITKEFDINRTEDIFIYDKIIWNNHFSSITSIEINSKFFKNIFIPQKNSYFSSFRSIIRTEKGDLYTVGSHELYRIKKGDTIPRKVSYFKRNLIVSAIYGLEKHNDSVFFAYGYSNRFFEINHESKVYNEYRIPSSAYLTIKDLQKINEDEYLIGTNVVGENGGLYQLNLKTKAVAYYDFFQDAAAVKKISVNDIHLDKLNNQIWVGTIEEGGLYKKDLNTGEILHYSTISKNLHLINDNVNCLLLDPDDANILWIGTENGLQKLNTKTNQSKYFFNNNILSSKIACIVKSNETLFVGTYDGLYKIDKNDNIINYGEIDGLPNKEFNKKSFLSVNDQSVYMGTVNGLAHFNPQKMEDDSFKKRRLSLVEKHEWDFDKGQFVTNQVNVQNQSVLNVSHKKNYLELKFSVADLLNPEYVEYKYRLNTGNEDWISLGNYNVLNLIALESGVHNLEVQAFNRNGIATNKLMYRINVSQVFYKEGWFIFILIVLAVFAFYAYTYSREKRAKMKYSISLLKSQALLSQMNPHFINNVLNGIQSKIIMNDEIAANGYIKSFSNLCKHTLNINASQFLLLRDEINYLKEYLHITQIKLNNVLNYSITIDDSIDINKVYIPTMLLQPIIENAIEHGLIKKNGEKILSISFYTKKKRLYVKIEDNGVGRKAASNNQKKSNKDIFKRPHALEIMKKRKKILNNLFKIKFDYKYHNLYREDTQDVKIAAGTKVILSLNICVTDFSEVHL